MGKGLDGRIEKGKGEEMGLGLAAISDAGPGYPAELYKAVRGNHSATMPDATETSRCRKRLSRRVYYGCGLSLVLQWPFQSSRNLFLHSSIMPSNLPAS